MITYQGWKLISLHLIAKSFGKSFKFHSYISLKEISLKAHSQVRDNFCH